MTIIFAGSITDSRRTIIDKVQQLCQESEYLENITIYYISNFEKILNIIALFGECEMIIFSINNLKNNFNKFVKFRNYAAQYIEHIYYLGIGNNEKTGYYAFKARLDDIELDSTLTAEKILETIKTIKATRYPKRHPQKIQITTMPDLEIKVNGQTINFAGKLSETLLAILINEKGRYLSRNSLAETLFGTEPDIDFDDLPAYKQNRNQGITNHRSKLRVALQKVKHILEEYHIEYLLEIKNNKIRIRLEDTECDFIELLKGNYKYIYQFNDRYLSKYEWAEPTLAEIVRFLTRLRLYINEEDCLEHIHRCQKEKEKQKQKQKQELEKQLHNSSKYNCKNPEFAKLLRQNFNPKIISKRTFRNKQ